MILLQQMCIRDRLDRVRIVELRQEMGIDLEPIDWEMGNNRTKKTELVRTLEKNVG